MKTTERNRFIGKVKTLYIHKDGERIAVSNTYWLITGPEARRFIGALVPFHLVPDGMHKLHKAGRIWEFEEGTGPDCFRLVERVQGANSMQGVHATGLYVHLDSPGEDYAVLRSEGELHLAHRSHWDSLADLYPGSQVRKEDGPRGVLVFESRSGDIQALLMPFPPRDGMPAPIQWLASIVSEVRDAKGRVA